MEVSVYFRNLLPIAAFATFSAWGQGLSAINGIVTDPSGAATPSARGTLSEGETSLSRETVANADGLYVLNSWRRTLYTLNAEGSIFRGFYSAAICLHSYDSATL